MRVPIAVQLGLLVLLTTVVGIAVLAVATVRSRIPSTRTIGTIAILTRQVVDHDIRFCGGCQVRITVSMREWYSWCFSAC